MSRSGICLFLAFLSLALPLKAATPEDPKDNSENRYKSLETLARGLFYLENLYVDPSKVKPDDLVYNALKGIVSTLDPHTMVMPRRAFDQLTSDTQGKFGGVGIIVSTERGKMIVVSPIEDTPAHRAGIKSGDEVTAIDGVLVEQIKGTDASEMMRGKPDTKITLTIKRKGEAKPIQFTIVREIIKVKSVRSADLGNRMIYTRISSFQDNTSDELKDIIEKNSKDIGGLILDLRDNPGGLLDQAVQVADLFIESGVIVSTVGRTAKDVEREFAHKKGTFNNLPLVVLINGGSASASEIVAGALQDHERALILGTTSFGKGSVQTLVSLPDHSGLKITVARYYTPKDRSIQAKGIVPDMYVAAEAAVAKIENTRKESDLKGHIESADLSELAKSSGVRSEIEQWDELMKGDYQLVSAYAFLRSMRFFGGKTALPTKS